MSLDFSQTAKSSSAKQGESAYYQQRSLSENTRKAYLSDARNFVRWLLNTDSVTETQVMETLASLSVAEVMRYLENQAEAINTRSLYRRMMGVSKLISAQGWANPIKDEQVKLMLAGIKRVNGKPPRKVEPLMINILSQTIESINKNEKELRIAARDKALLLVAFGGALRRSELVGLDAESVQFSAQGLRLTILNSKTDKNNEGQTLAIPYAKNAHICPVRALKTWLELSEIRTGALFRPFSKSYRLLNRRLSDHAYYKILKARIAQAGFNPQLFAGHSPRRGLITEAAIADVKEHKILAQSRHKSRVMLDEYIKDANLFKDNAAGIL
jgi:integrase